LTIIIFLKIQINYQSISNKGLVNEPDLYSANEIARIFSFGRNGCSAFFTFMDLPQQ